MTVADKHVSVRRQTKDRQLVSPARPACRPELCAVSVIVVSGAGLFVGGGVLIGWAVDPNIHETVYEAPGTVWSFRPLLTKGGASASMSLEW